MNRPLTVKQDRSTLVKPKFAPGMLLQHDDLELLNAYTLNLSRLMFRSLLGCGVVCGLVVTGQDRCGELIITVHAGLAIDPAGNPVHVPKDYTFTLEDIGDAPRTEVWVVLRATTKCCATRNAMCNSDDDEPVSVCTREWDGYELRIFAEYPQCACGCYGEKPRIPGTDGAQTNGSNSCLCANPGLECHKNHYAGICSCSCGEDCGCGCDGILLARLSRTNNQTPWKADHSVRRFIRPVLMRDPQVEVEAGNSPTPTAAAYMADPRFMQVAEQSVSAGAAAATPAVTPAEAAAASEGAATGAMNVTAAPAAARARAAARRRAAAPAPAVAPAPAPAAPPAETPAAGNAATPTNTGG